MPCHLNLYFVYFSATVDRNLSKILQDRLLKRKTPIALAMSDRPEILS